MVNIGGFLGGAATVSIAIVVADKFSKGFDKATKRVRKFGMVSVNTMALVKSAAIGVASAIAIIAAGLVRFGFASVKAAADLEPLMNSLRRISGNADEVLHSLRDATRGIVTDFELIKNANLALLLGVRQNDLPQFFKTALLLGRATGRTVSEAIQDITTGVARQRNVILDNIGIKVDIVKANNKFAESNGLVVQSLTDEQKSLAFIEATLRATAGITEKLADENLTFNERLSKLKTTINRIQVSVGKDLIPQLTDLLEMFEQNEDAITEFGRIAGDILVTAVKGVTFVVLNFTKGMDLLALNTHVLIERIKTLGFFFSELKEKGLKKAAIGFAAANAELTDYKDHQELLIETGLKYQKVQEDTNDVVDDGTEKYKAQKEAIEELKEKMDSARDSAVRFLQKLGKGGREVSLDAFQILRERLGTGESLSGLALGGSGELLQNGERLALSEEAGEIVKMEQSSQAPINIKVVLDSTEIGAAILREQATR